MRAWFLFGAVSAAGGIALVSADVIGPLNFNVTEELLQLGVDVSSIPALESFSGTQTRSTAGACAAEVSRIIHEVNPMDSCFQMLTSRRLVRELEVSLRITTSQCAKYDPV